MNSVDVARPYDMSTMMLKRSVAIVFGFYVVITIELSAVKDIFVD